MVICLGLKSSVDTNLLLHIARLIDACRKGCFHGALLSEAYLLMPMDGVMEYAINTILSNVGQAGRKGGKGHAAMAVTENATANVMAQDEIIPQDSTPPPPDPTAFVFTISSLSVNVVIRSSQGVPCIITLTETGTLDDLYDFDYEDGGLPAQGAVVQIGWDPAITGRDAGRIFFDEVNFQESFNDWDYSFLQ